MRIFTSTMLKEILFEDEDDRRGFVAQCLQESASDQAGVRAALDPTRLWHDAYGRVAQAAAFLPSEDIEARRLMLAWIRAMDASDVVSVVILYTLSADKTDFAKLERLIPDWYPAEINPGERISYQGKAYPLHGARGVVIDVHGEYTIEDIVPDEIDAWWYEICDVRDGESLWLTEPLLLTATFTDSSLQQVDPSTR